jgi:hypothetical protein
MVSEDCAQKAVCKEEGGTGSDATSDLGGATGDDLTTTDNDASDVIVSETVGPDADAGDGVGEDVNIKDVVAEDVLLADGCTAPDMCGAVPTGWQAALFWTGASSAIPPNCPGDTQTVDLKGVLTPGGPDTCGCTCPLSDKCSTTGTFHFDQSCLQMCVVDGGGTATVSVTPDPSGACTAVPANFCGAGGSFDTPALMRITYDGGCIPTPTVTPGSASSWTTAARLCSRPVASGVCGANQQCLLAVTTDLTKVCIYQAGDMVCPPPPSPYSNKTLLYLGQNDSRGCSPCTCGNPTAGSCLGNISVYGTKDCTGPASNYSFLLASCQIYNAFPNPQSVKAAYTVTHGTCPTPSTPQPEGGVSPAGPTTVCCM